MWIKPNQAAAAEQSQATALALVPMELLFPAVEPPLQTVWKFLFDHEPWTLTSMRDAVLGLIVEDERAARIATDLRLHFVLIDAPPELAAAGRPKVGCYPLAVLFDVFA